MDLLHKKQENLERLKSEREKKRKKGEKEELVSKSMQYV